MMEMNSGRFVRARMIAAAAMLATLGAVACGPTHDAGPSAKPDSAGVKVDSENGAVGVDAVPAATSHQKQFAGAPQMPVDTSKKTDTSSGKKADTSSKRAYPPISFSLMKGRSTADSFSLLVAIKSGLRMMDKWPSHEALTGSILPTKRIVAFYGNPLSKKMGVLGEYPVDEMLAKFDKIIAEWKAADPATPVQPALQLITVVAQGTPGRDGKYRLRMADSLVEKVYGWAKSRNALLFLDVQVGQSTVQEELPRLIPFLSRPDVHLAIDPEFSMHYAKEGVPPGGKIGTMDAADVNYAVDLLNKVVTENKLPPKVLIVHRFTRPMLHNAASIKVEPNVQLVMNMDGWGQPWLKFDSYEAYIVREPVQYTGFKLFFHNDTKKGDALLTAREVLQLLPRPLYIQYQ
ncbi:MAG TPA: hypothetical protein VIV65_12490 [Gemmatimonadaceae bacterium]